jgi:hypothetical protein
MTRTRPRALVAVLLVLLIVINMIPGAQRLQRLRGYYVEDPFDWRDWLWYLLLPTGSQLLLLVAAIGLWRGDERALLAMAGAVVLLLVVGVRNAWDLVLFLLSKR